MKNRKIKEAQEKKIKEAQETIKLLRDTAVKGFERIKDDFLALESGYLALLDDKLVERARCQNKSHISQKLIKAKVRKIVRDILKTYFANDRLADISIKGDERLTKAMQNELDALTKRKSNLYTLIRPSVRDMLVYGTCIAKVYWDSEENQVKIQPKAINEVLLDPNARNHFDCKFFVEQFYMSIEDIKETFKGKLQGIDLDGASATMNGNSLHDNDLGDYKRIQVREVYRKVGDKWYISTLINDFFIRTDIELKDGHPFIFGIAYPQFVKIDEAGAIRSYGDSYIEPMIPIQQQFIVTRNQQMDAVFKQLNPRLLSTRTSGLRDDDLLSNNPKIIVNNLSEIKELPTPNIAQSMFDVNRLDEELQEVGGLPKLNQGITSGTDPRSATGMSLMVESGNAVIDDIITSFNESFFEPMIYRVLTLIYKYKISEDFVGYDRESVIVFDVNLNAGVGAVNRDVRINGIGSAKQSLMTAIKVFSEAGLTEKQAEYIALLDELTIEEMKTLGVKNIESKITKGVSVDDIARQASQNTTV